jgi:Cu(I)/Ag(I) efflux system periplasmic protein CusF
MSSPKSILSFVLFTGLLMPGLPRDSVAQDSSGIVGEVTKVDFTAGKITISHGPNGQLALQQSTDDFRAQEPILLNALRPGTKIRFAADRVNGELVITKILTD